MHLSFTQKKVSGFTTLYAVLVASMLLAVGAAIFTISYHETIFATIARDSNTALYAADTGEECALYWDFRYSGASGSIFPASPSDPQSPGAGAASCDGQDVVAAGWQVAASNNDGIPQATTTFSLDLRPSTAVAGPCVDVAVAKYGTPTHTFVTARGHNICATGSTNRIERAIEARY